MYKNAVISELLYYMALRLKGGIGVKKIWTKKYRDRLESILSFMEKSTDLLETRRDITKEEIMPLVDFVNDNIGSLFLVKRIDIEDFCNNDSELILVDNCSWDIYDENIIRYMRQIISEVRECLKNRQKGYKRKIQDLFHDYHNLPRAYLSKAYDPNIQTTFLGKDYSRWALSKTSALEYSQKCIMPLSTKI